MNLLEKFFAIINALNQKQVEYIIIGGFAVIMYGLPRLTQDIDIFIRPDEENVHKLKEALKSIYQDESIDAINLGMFNDYAVVRYGTTDDFYIDILTRLGNAFEYNSLDYDIKNIKGHDVRIATVDTLIKMKSDTLCPIDHEDVLFLKSLQKRGL